MFIFCWVFLYLNFIYRHSPRVCNKNVYNNFQSHKLSAVLFGVYYFLPYHFIYKFITIFFFSLFIFIYRFFQHKIRVYSVASLLPLLHNQGVCCCTGSIKYIYFYDHFRLLNEIELNRIE